MRPQEQNIYMTLQETTYSFMIQKSKQVSHKEMMKKISIFITTESMGILDYC